MDIYANEGDRTAHDCTSKMAELESSLTAIDWLTGLKVGVTGDCSWSDAGRRMLDTNSVNGNDAATVPQSTEGASVGHQKPGYSYSSLIYLAIGSSAERRMTLSEIYRWICDRFPYYRTADPGWKVSPRSPMKYAYNALFRTCRSRFLANVLHAIARPSVCLSSVTLVRSTQAFKFRQYFYGIWYLGHPLTSMENFTEIVPGSPSVGGVTHKRGSQV